ncbi:GNAT family N-acetyltransferase [Pseudomonas aeruginosa]|nr:GNAT family N-acetyltransferase [Pseudomonas aeruginosa]MBH9228635.1 GNAT family N-acetyltransferase [Pseudomonas aeruginosa]
MCDVMLHFREEGEEMLGKELIPKVIQETPEMSWSVPPEGAALRLIKSTEENDRWEITARDTSGRLVGYAVVVEDFDSNVGPVAGVQWMYVCPEARGGLGSTIFRAVIEAARLEQLDIVAYTRRSGVGKYELNYKRLKPRSPNG